MWNLYMLPQNLFWVLFSNSSIVFFFNSFNLFCFLYVWINLYFIPTDYEKNTPIFVLIYNFDSSEERICQIICWRTRNTTRTEKYKFRNFCNPCGGLLTFNFVLHSTKQVSGVNKIATCILILQHLLIPRTKKTVAVE